MSALDKIVSQLNKVFLLVDKPSGGGNTTLTAAPAIGATSLTVAAITNFAANDTIRVGSGNTMERCDVVSAVGTTITIAQGLVYQHASGEAVVEQVAYDLGAIEAGGVTIEASGQSTDIPVATQRLAFSTLAGYITADATFSLPCFTIPFLALATGALQSLVTGAGTQTSPTQFTTNGSEFGGVQNACIVAVGTTMDGSYIRAELWAVGFDYTAVSVKLARGAAVSIPVKAVAGAGGALFSSNYGFTPDTSLMPTNAKVWDALTETGVFVIPGSPTTTTTTALVAAGATTVPVASATGIAANVWLQVGAGSSAMFLWVDSVASLNVTVRNAPYRAIPNGTTITIVTQTPFGATSSDGVSLQIGGSVSDINIAESRTTIGVRYGAATVSALANIVAIVLANAAYALGIAQSQIVNGRLPLNNNIGATALDGFYFKGTLKDGTTCWVICAGNNMDVSKFALQLTNNGDPASVPIAAKPSSYVQFLQHP